MILDLIIIILIMCIFYKLYLTPKTNESFSGSPNEILLVTNTHALMFRGRTYHFVSDSNGKYLVRLNNNINMCESAALVKHADNLFALHYSDKYGQYLWFNISDLLVPGITIEPVCQVKSKILDAIVNNTIKNSNVNKKLSNILIDMSTESLANNSDKVVLGNKTFEVRANKLCVMPENKVNTIYCNRDKLAVKAIYYNMATEKLNCIDDKNKIYAINSDHRTAVPVSLDSVCVKKILDKCKPKPVVLDMTRLETDKDVVMIGYNSEKHLSVGNDLYKIEKNKVIKYTDNNGMVYEYEKYINAILYFAEANTVYVKDNENNWYPLGIRQKLKPSYCTNLNTYLLKILTHKNKEAYLSS